MDDRLASCLLPDRKNQLGEFYFTLKGKVIAKKTFDFGSIKQVFKEEKAGLVHSFPCKNESRAEFYDTLFGLIITNFMHDVFLSQLVDLCLIYIIHSTMPNAIRNQNKISINSDCLEKLLIFSQSAVESKNIEILELIRHMIDSDCFVLSQKIGIKTVLLDKSGNIKQTKKLIKPELLMELNKDSIKNDLTRRGVFNDCIGSLNDYLKEKAALINTYVIEDDTEALTYDESSKKLIKRTQKQLGLVDNESVNKLKKAI